jgi:hypothetical protein
MTDIVGFCGPSLFSPVMGAPFFGLRIGLEDFMGA